MRMQAHHRKKQISAGKDADAGQKSASILTDAYTLHG